MPKENNRVWEYPRGCRKHKMLGKYGCWENMDELHALKNCVIIITSIRMRIILKICGKQRKMERLG